MVYLMIPPSTIGAIYYATEAIRFYKGEPVRATLDNIFHEKLVTTLGQVSLFPFVFSVSVFSSGFCPHFS